MFKFAFEVEEEEDRDFELQASAGPSNSSQRDTKTSASRAAEACHHVTLDELLGSLPDAISYSPLWVPGLEQPVLRRDLFDARFQLSQKDKEVSDGSSGNNDEEEEYVDSSTDLIPGLYEGGLKTWEGGVDLIEVLSRTEDQWTRGARILEVGCGTAVPSAFLLSALFSSSQPLQPSSSEPLYPSPSSTSTVFHLQDFNRPVLELVTLPNLLLALLPHLPVEVLHENSDEDNEMEDVVPDLTQPGMVSITPAVKEALKSLLASQHVELKFTHGFWSGLATDIEASEERYDLVLTSETIYAQESVDDLTAVLRAAYSSKKEGALQKVEVGLEDSLGDLQLDAWRTKPLAESTETVILVAAKVLYFGVGGGLQDFLRKVKQDGGWYENVKEWITGVGRKVVRIGW